MIKREPTLIRFKCPNCGKEFLYKVKRGFQFELLSEEKEKKEQEKKENKKEIKFFI